MHLARMALLLGFLFPLTLFSAQFREYYRSGEQVAPQQPAPSPAPVQAPPIRRIEPPAQAPRPALQPPAAPARPAVRGIRSGHFGWNGDWLVRASLGAVAQSRSVTVETADLATNDEVYYRPDNKLMGTADGSVLTHDATDLLFRLQLGLGYQMPGEGNFWLIELYSAGDLQETLFSYAWTLPGYTFSGSIPYLKALVGMGHVDAEGLSPTSLSFGVGAGAYNWLTRTRNWRLEYGLDLTRREWLPIEHNYGPEAWVDTEWHLYLGTAWRF